MTLEANINNLKWTLAKLHELDRKVILNKESDLLSEERHEFNFLRELLDSQKIEILISIYKPNEYFGYVAVKSKVNEEPFTREDIDVLKNINESLMLDISKSLLYKKVQDFNTLLNSKVQEATKELQQKNVDLADALQKEKDMIDIFSHELRTPAGTARNAIQMIEIILKDSIKKGFITQEFASKPLEFIDKGVVNIRRLSDIIDRMLNSSMLDSGTLHLKPQQTDFIELLKSSYDEYLLKAQGKELKFTLNLPNYPIVGMMDKKIVKDIIDNLFDNAIKYTSQGEVFAQVELTPDKFIKLSVKDTGIGIPAAEIAKLGKRYYRVNNYLDGSGRNGMTLLRPDGPGIGLSNIKGYLKLMNGRLDIYSEGEGKGSTFTVYIPLVLKV